jgi:hypothetical protein
MIGAWFAPTDFRVRREQMSNGLIHIEVSTDQGGPILRGHFLPTEMGEAIGGAIARACSYGIE